MGYRGYSEIAVVLCLIVVGGCKREERQFQVNPPSASVLQGLKLSELQPGPVVTNPPVKNKYESNAQALADGKRLFSAFNCVGCHANGGGGMGPALMDDKWIYGSNPEQIYATITQGRPNGMPSFGGKVPEYQVWQLAAYVRSISGLVPKDAAPGRNDDMKANPPENSGIREQPKKQGPLQ
jgi:cytochrome c oxidase cbb3-type subunit III